MHGKLPMNRPKKQHQTPQAYLSNFADARGRVSVYDRITQKTRLDHVWNVAAENDLYTFTDKEGNKSDAFELGILQDMDSAVAHVLPRLLELRPKLTHQEREFVHYFIALQHGRTSYMRDMIADIVDLMMRSEIEASIAGWTPEDIERRIAEFDPYASEREKANIRATASDLSKPIPLNVEHWMCSLVRLLPSLVSDMDSRAWILLDARGATFLTGDLPIILDGLHPLAISNAPAIYWPLSPTKALMLREPGSYNGRGFQGGTALPDLVHDINQLTALHAARQIIWHPDTIPTAGITLPKGPHLSEVNGITVRPGERSYDKLRKTRLAGEIEACDKPQ